MKTVMMLIPRDLSPRINKSGYLSSCINKLLQEGKMPLTPDLYGMFNSKKRDVFVKKLMPVVSEIILFADYGMDDYMIMIQQIGLTGSVPVSITRLLNDDVIRFFNTPEHVLQQFLGLIDMTFEELTASRKQRLVDLRFVYMRKCREVTMATLAEIGATIGKSHCDVLAGIKNAYNVKEVVELYNEIYGEGEAAIQTVGIESAKRGEPDLDKGKERVLPHIEVEKGERSIQKRQPAVYRLREDRADDTIRGDGPRSATRVMLGSVG